MRTAVLWLMSLYLFALPVPAVHEGATVYATESMVVIPPTLNDTDNGYNPEAYRRGGFRSPRMGYRDGNRARNPAVNNPGARTPAAPARRGGFMGGLFGGLLAGTLLGSIMNPFGFGVPGGFSLLGLLIWGVILYFAYRLIKRAMRSRER